MIRLEVFDGEAHLENFILEVLSDEHLEARVSFYEVVRRGFIKECIPDMVVDGRVVEVRDVEGDAVEVLVEVAGDLREGQLERL